MLPSTDFEELDILSLSCVPQGGLQTMLTRPLASCQSLQIITIKKKYSSASLLACFIRVCARNILFCKALLNSVIF